MAFIIRPATAADAQAIGALAREFADYLRDLGDKTDFKLTADAVLRDGFGANPAFAGLIAEDDDRISGYLLYHFGYDTDAACRNVHIVDLYVSSNARRQGIGKALMTAVSQIARQSNAHAMIWSVYYANQLATSFYEHLGAQHLNDLDFMWIDTRAI